MSRTALITGASAGLGAEFARQLAADGWNLVLVARRAEKLDELAQTLTHKHNINVTTLSMDLADPNARCAIETQLREADITVDFLVNNAGSGGLDLLDDPGWQDQSQYLQMMMLSVAEMCHRFVPPMRARVIRAGHQCRLGRCTRYSSRRYQLRPQQGLPGRIV